MGSVGVAGALEETVAVDDDAHDLTDCDLGSRGIVGLHLEREAPPLDPGEHGGDRHGAPGARRGDMVDPDAHAHGGLAGFELAFERDDGCLFAPGDDARSCQHGHISRRELGSEIAVADLVDDGSGQPDFERHVGTIRIPLDRHTDGHRRRGRRRPPSYHRDDRGGRRQNAGTRLERMHDGFVDQDVIERTLAAAVAHGGDFAEVFIEDKRNARALLDDGKVEELSSGRDRGAGIRVVVGETTGFAHTADLSEAGLRAAAEAAGAAARGGGGGVRIVPLSRVEAPSPNRVAVLPETVAKAAKVELLQRANEVARAQGALITQVAVSYADSRRRILVANTDGVLASDDQVRSLFSVSCVANADAGMQTGRESVGRPIGFELFDEVDIAELAQRAAQRAITKLRARPAPSGTMPVVIGKGGGGVLFHEACGHGLEADLVKKQASVFAGRTGQKVASELVTLIDDGTMGREWGAFAIDDEGRPAQRNVLIEDGVLVDYMWDGLRARREGRASSGNGRRQSYDVLPMVRMTNTYIANGRTDPADIIADTESGVYVADLGGGQVNTATGDFVFGMTEAYLIENGEITEPIREGNLIGNGPEVLTLIDALGNDFEMGSPGTCGKDGQGVPVGDGTPTLRVTALTVGGTAA